MAEEITNEETETVSTETESTTTEQTESTEESKTESESAEASSENTEAETGEQETDSTEETTANEETTEVTAPEDFDYAKYEGEFNDSGELSKESLEALYKVFPKNLVDNYYVNMQSATSYAIAQSEAKAFTAVGGEDNYMKMMSWANGSLDKAEVESYNSVISGGDEQLALITIKGLQARMEASDKKPNITMGDTNTAVETGDTYMTRTDYASALGSDEYASSPQYRAEVDKKLARTLKSGGFKA